MESAIIIDDKGKIHYPSELTHVEFFYENLYQKIPKSRIIKNWERNSDKYITIIKLNTDKYILSNFMKFMKEEKDVYKIATKFWFTLADLFLHDVYYYCAPSLGFINGYRNNLSCSFRVTSNDDFLDSQIKSILVLLEDVYSIDVDYFTFDPKHGVKFKNYVRYNKNEFLSEVL